MRCLSLAVAVALIAMPAHAVIAPKYLLEDRAQADNHVQVEVFGIVRDKAAQTCRLHTLVRNAWAQNGHKAPKAGSAFDFAVPCLFKGQEAPAGPTLWFDPNAIHLHMVMEGYFTNGQAVRDQVFIVPYPRPQAWCDTQTYDCGA